MHRSAVVSTPPSGDTVRMHVALTLTLVSHTRTGPETSWPSPTTPRGTTPADKSTWIKCEAALCNVALGDAGSTPAAHRPCLLFRLRYVRLSLQTNKDGKIPVKK